MTPTRHLPETPPKMKSKMHFQALGALLLLCFATQCAQRGDQSPMPGGAWGAGQQDQLAFQELPRRDERYSLYGPGSENVRRDPVNPVYFAFDSDVVEAGEMGKIEQLASIARSTLIIIAGHTDATGTLEYNRALGERRALAVRNELLLRGVPVANIQTISYGEDMLTGSGDAYDRRAEFGAVMP